MLLLLRIPINHTMTLIGTQIPQPDLFVPLKTLSKYFHMNNCQKPWWMSCNIPFHKGQHESNLQNANKKHFQTPLSHPKGLLQVPILKIQAHSLSKSKMEEKNSKYLANHMKSCEQLQTLSISSLQVLKNWVLRSCGKFVKN
mgnify:CR=1 FL=1